MATTTYYFDGHSGITDPDSVWSNDANAFNGDNTTNASVSTSGDSSVNYLQGVGTTAPTTGTAITQVRVRIDGGSAGHTYGSYDTLTPPSGGWSWSEVNGLVVRIVGALGMPGDYYVRAYIRSSGAEDLGQPETYIASFFGTFNAYKVEIEVTHDDPTSELENVVSISNVVSITL